MKRILILLLLTSLIYACKPWDHTMMRPIQSPISPKLLTLERQMDDMENTVAEVSTIYGEFFTKEVEENLIDPYGEKYGYISFKVLYYEGRDGSLLFFLNVMTGFVPSLCGVPVARIKENVEIEIRILDKNKKLIGKYTGSGKSKVPIAFYYGYKGKDGIEKSTTDLLNDAFSKIRPQIEADAERINSHLRVVGPISPSE